METNFENESNNAQSQAMFDLMNCSVSTSFDNEEWPAVSFDGNSSDQLCNDCSMISSQIRNLTL